jgi:hypothetical protein
MSRFDKIEQSDIVKLIKKHVGLIPAGGVAVAGPQGPQGPQGIQGTTGAVGTAIVDGGFASDTYTNIEIIDGGTP